MAIIKWRRATAAQWSSDNPVLREGEAGYILGSSPVRFKLGDGVTPWNSLPGFVDETETGGAADFIDNGDGGFTSGTVKLAGHGWVVANFATIADAVPLGTALPQPLGIPFAGTEEEAARVDHVHGMPLAKPQVVGISSGQTGLMSPPGNNASCSVDRAQFGPHWVSRPDREPVAVTALGVYVATASDAAGTIRHALWKSDPETGAIDLSQKIYESGEISSTTNGAKMFAITTTLPEGLYWLGVVMHTDDCQIQSSNSGIVVQDPNNAHNAFPMMYKDSVTGSMPTSGVNPNGDFAPNLLYTAA